MGECTDDLKNHCSINPHSKQFESRQSANTQSVSVEVYLEVIICDPAVRACRHGWKSTSKTHTDKYMSLTPPGSLISSLVQ